jgi:beta-lactamase class A
LPHGRIDGMTDLAALFDDAGVTAAFLAVDLDTGREVAHHAEDLVVTASVFKLPVLLELCRQHAAGEIDATAPVEVPVAQRAPGPFGLSQMQDPTTMSLRDLAWLMMGISDNAATDVVCAHVGLDNVAATLQRLGLTSTSIGGDCRDLFRTIEEDLEVDSIEELVPSWEMLEKLRATDPERSLHVSTPRDITRLLSMIWKDEAAPAEACAEARRILGLQVWPHRLASGFADMDEVRTSGKTGTLPIIRNEAGVVEYPDGGRYAVAVFTRSSSLAQKNPAADAVIGAAARHAVDALRS